MNRRKPRVFGTLIAVAFLGLASSTLKAAMEDPINSGKSDNDKGGQQGQKSKKEKKSEQQFRDRYLQARALILEKKYQEAISTLHKIGRDDLPDIANYIGYSYRMLGDYDGAKIWYEKALASDPNHIRTWQYYGMWQVERGNMLKAAEHLEKLRQLCGTDCKEYADLKSAMEGHVRY